MKRKKLRTGLYMLGSVALAACALLLAPRVIDRLSGLLYAAPAPAEDEDWGPELVKREETEDGAAEEEETDGEF